MATGFFSSRASRLTGLAAAMARRAAITMNFILRFGADWKEDELKKR